METENVQDDSQSSDHITDEEAKAASRSLAEALRVSFKLLSMLMIVVLVLFVFSGWRQIDTSQRGVKLLFGGILGQGHQRVVKDGLRFSWPEPVGRILTVSTEQKELATEEFWMYETPEESLKPLSERMASAEGLRPGWDGALLTGDRALVHVKLTCNYRLGTRNGTAQPGRVIDYFINVADAEKLVEAAVCNAAINSAAKRTAESIYVAERETFENEVAQLAQRRLDEINSGIEIQSILLSRRTVPLAAIRAFDDVIDARQEREDNINKARTEANQILNGAAGNAWAELTGDVDKAAKEGTIERTNRPEVFRRYRLARRAGDTDKTKAELEKIRGFGLLSLYSDAREDHQQEFADEVLAEVNEVLTGNRIGGAAAGIISQARAYRSSVQQRVAGDVAEFRKLVDKFKDSPELMMERLWAAVKTDILNSPTVEKHYLTPTQKIVIRVSRDPEARRRALRRALETDKEEQDKQQ